MSGYTKRAAELEGMLRSAQAPSASRVAARWETMPKGWTDESRKKFWDTMTGDVKHKVTKCIKEMDGKVGDPGAFCAALADRVDGKEWRSKKGSTNTERNFYKARDGQWYAENEEYDEDEDGEQIEGETTTWGPFPSFKAAESWINGNYGNAGGDSTDDSGRAAVPRDAVKPRRWGSDKTACCGGCADPEKLHSPCEGVRQPLSLAPDYGHSDAALPRGASSARVMDAYRKAKGL